MVYPVHLLRRLGRRNIEINNDRLLLIAHDDTAEWFVVARINLLMENERWNVDEVARARFRDILQPFARAHARLALHHIDHALQLAPST